MSSMDDSGKLGSLADLVKEHRSLERKMDSVSEELKALKERKDRISEELIPDSMMELGMQEIKLSDGASLSIQRAYFARIPDQHKEQAYAWLTEKGLDSLIKKEVTAYFGKGESEQAQQLELDLQNGKQNFSTKEAIHPSTLKALVKERMESGDEIPEDLFGIYVKNITKIK